MLCAARRGSVDPVKAAAAPPPTVSTLSGQQKAQLQPSARQYRLYHAQSLLSETINREGGRSMEITLLAEAKRASPQLIDIGRRSCGERHASFWCK